MAEPEEEEEEAAYDVVETEAKAFVRAILKSLVEKLRTSRDVKVKKITSEMITCLSRYYTLQEMVLHMVSTTKVTVKKPSSSTWLSQGTTHVEVKLTLDTLRSVKLPEKKQREDSNSRFESLNFVDLNATMKRRAQVVAACKATQASLKH